MDAGPTHTGNDATRADDDATATVAAPAPAEPCNPNPDVGADHCGITGLFTGSDPVNRGTFTDDPRRPSRDHDAFSTPTGAFALRADCTGAFAAPDPPDGGDTNGDGPEGADETGDDSGGGLVSALAGTPTRPSTTTSDVTDDTRDTARTAARERATTPTPRTGDQPRRTRSRGRRTRRTGR